MSTTRDPELEAFKQIDLRVYAAEVEFYVLDRKESWAGSSVMRHPNGDKIIIKRDAGGHHVYFSVRDESDNGSIIDFVQKRRPGVRSLGKVRQALRPWIGKVGPSPALFPALNPTTKDGLEVERQFRLMEDAGRHGYLENDRRLPASVLAAPRFAGRIKADARGNAVFPHFRFSGANEEWELCGYEIKNRGFTGFSKGGEKGLWISHSEQMDGRLVICESAIDALSYATLFSDAGARYASIGGQMNPQQPVLLKAVAMNLPNSVEVIAAMDADANGRKYAELVRMAVIETGRGDLRFSVHEPVGVKDWNDVLRLRNPAASSQMKQHLCVR